MNFGLKDFFMGVVHLFVIFLPGAVVVLTMLYAMPDYRDIPSDLGIGGIGTALLFVGASYFVGHIVSLGASWLEDELPAGLRSNELGRRKAAMRRRALVICTNVLGDDVVSRGNLRNWCKHLVRKTGGVFQVDVDTKDADRRFFRNIRLVLILPLLVVASKLWQTGLDDRTLLNTEVGLLAATFFAFLRYHDQDGKFTNLLFEALIVTSDESHHTAPLEPTHAGGVVYRRKWPGYEYLLVGPKGGEPDEWLLSKGHINDGEAPEQAAAREVEEETGGEVRVQAFLGFSGFVADGKRVNLASYLMEARRGPFVSKEKRRDPAWMRFADALEKLTYEESKEVLKSAREALGSGWPRDRDEISE